MVEFVTMKTQLQTRIVTEQEWTGTILGIAILFGIFVRILPLFLAGFPINDGGMFAAMMRDLRAGNFALPMFTTYNQMDIPYAYPPLGFYLGALSETAGMPDTQVLMWLPALFTALTVPLFYVFAKEIMGDRPRAALAAAFFALAPGNYVWLLMGGGLTRALGTVFFISSLIFVHRVFVNPSWRITVPAVISCSLVVMSHPQTALLTVLSCAVFWFFYGRSRLSTIHAFAIVIGTLLLTLPWWGTVIYRHGIETFFSAGQSGDLNISLKALWENLLSFQTILPFATIFRWMGLGWLIYRRRFDLLVWGFLPYFIDQRSASIVTSFLYPILAAYGFADVLPIFVNFVRARKWLTEKDDSFFNQRALSMSLLGILFYLIIECFVHAYVIRNVTLSLDSRNMMAWVNNNTPVDSSFLILTGREDVMTDPVQEWFPFLAERHSSTTLQGLEWVVGKDFNTRWDNLSFLQDCRDMVCVETFSSKVDAQYTYVILDKHNAVIELSALFLDEGYGDAYENDQYLLLKK